VNQVKKSIATYQSIAVDIAKRIVNAEFSVGDKISGRTLLASQYNVSPETIRKAVALLKEANIVSVSQGKEIIILSSQQAYHLIEHNKEMTSAYSLRQELEILLERKEETDRDFRKIITEIMRYSDRLKNLAPYNPIEVHISKQSKVIGQSLAGIKLWHNTGATVVAIRRNTEIIVSPGPYAVLQENDRIVVVGPHDVLQKVTDYINNV
jgi:K+/H+ antiporter YhaU regulatory subunit KhtT